MNKSTKAILRDCLKAVPFMKQVNPNLNVNQTRAIIIQQFEQNKHVQNEQEIEKLRKRAIVAMSNFYVHSIKQEYLKNKEHYDKAQKINESINQD